MLKAEVKEKILECMKRQNRWGIARLNCKNRLESIQW